MVRRENTRSLSDLDMWNRLAPYVLKLFGRHGKSPPRMKQKRRKCVFNSFAFFELWVKKRGGGIGQLIRLMTWRLQVRILSPHAQWVRTQPLYLSTLMQSVKYGVSASIYISRTYENCKTKLGKGILIVHWVKGVPFVWGSWKSWLWLIPFLRDVAKKKDCLRYAMPALKFKTCRLLPTTRFFICQFLLLLPVRTMLVSYENVIKTPLYTPLPISTTVSSETKLAYLPFETAWARATIHVT